MTSHHEPTISEHLCNSDIKSATTGYTIISVEREPTLSRKLLDQTIDNKTQTAKTADCANKDNGLTDDEIVKSQLCKSAKEPVIFRNNNQPKETGGKHAETSKTTAQTVKGRLVDPADESLRFKSPAAKKDLTTLAINAVPDQPAHPRSLIRAYAARHSVHEVESLASTNSNAEGETDNKNEDNSKATHKTAQGEFCEQLSQSLVDRTSEADMGPGCENVDTGKTSHKTVDDGIGKQAADSLEDKTAAPAKTTGCNNEHNSKTTHKAGKDETDMQQVQSLLNRNTEQAMETGCKNEGSSKTTDQTTDQTVMNGIRGVPVQTLINKQMEGKRKIKHEPKKPSFIAQNIAAASIAGLSDKPRFRAGANKHDIPPIVSRQNNQSESKLDKGTSPRLRPLGTEGGASVTSSMSDVLQYSYYHDWQQRRPQPARERVHKRRSKNPPPIAYLNLPMKTTGGSFAWKTTKEPLKRPVKDQHPLNHIPNKPPESAYGLGPSFQKRINLPKIQPKSKNEISETHTSYLRKLPKTIGGNSLWKMPKFLNNSKPVVQSYRASDARQWGMRISCGINSQQQPPLPPTDR